MDNGTTIAPHLSVELLENYLSDQLDDKQRHRVEKHLMSCALCADAMEGLSESAPAAFSDDLSDLEQRLKQKIDDKKKGGLIAWPYYRAAAVVVLLMLSGVVIYFFNFQDNSKSSELAVDQKEMAPTSDQGVIEKGTTSDPTTEEISELSSESQQPVSSSEGDTYRQAQPVETKQEESKAATESAVVLRQESNTPEPEDAPKNEESRSQLADTHTVAAGEEAATVEGAAEDSFKEASSPAPEVESRAKLAYKTSAPKRKKVLPQAIIPHDPYRTIVGKVTSSDNGRPIAGIRIEVKNTKISTFTDNQGDYILAAPLEARALVMTYQGYTAQELPLVLELKKEAMDEQVVADSDAAGLDDSNAGDRLNLGISNYTLSREDSEPIPVGGMEAYIRYLTSSENKDKKYVKSLSNRSSVVEVGFTVQADGRLTDFELTNESEGCKNQVIEKIQNGPEWIPGTNNSQPLKKQVFLSVPCDL